MKAILDIRKPLRGRPDQSCYWLFNKLLELWVLWQRRLSFERFFFLGPFDAKWKEWNEEVVRLKHSLKPPGCTEASAEIRKLTRYPSEREGTCHHWLTASSRPRPGCCDNKPFMMQMEASRGRSHSRTFFALIKKQKNIPADGSWWQLLKWNLTVMNHLIRCCFLCLAEAWRREAEVN